MLPLRASVGSTEVCRTDAHPLTRRLGFELERGHVVARRGTEHPPVLPAELGRALVPDAKRSLGRVNSLA